jgi:cytochrome d ubiquinol oxidase subunit I
MVFNPSSVPRLIHVWFGAFILGAFFVMSISAWYLLRGRHREFARRSFSGALVLAMIFSAAQLVSGDVEARLVAKYQPAKLAAAEGLYRTQPYAPLHLFGWPDDAKQRVEYGVAIPGLLSLLVHHDASKPVAGLEDLQDLWGTPPVWIVFQSFHAMVAIGMLFIGATLLGCWLRVRGTLFEKRWLLWFFVLAVPLAFLANELGWVTAEVGRQPWIVYPTLVNGQLVGGLLTSEGLSRSVGAGQVLGSLLMFGVLYALLFSVWITVLNHKIRQGPEPVGAAPPETTVDAVFESAARITGHEASLTEAKPEGD